MSRQSANFAAFPVLTQDSQGPQKVLSADRRQPIRSSCIRPLTTQEQVDALAPTVAGKAEGDAVVWFAYPKGSSKQYKSQINRDHGWDLLGQKGFEPVRMVAIDEDWSAIRFRRAAFIKNMTRAREHRLTERSRTQPSKT